MADSAPVTIDEVLAHFDQLEDPRSTVNRLHSLSSVIVIAIMALLSGAAGPTAIADWAKIKADLLTEWLKRRSCGWDDKFMMQVLTGDCT